MTTYSAATCGFLPLHLYEGPELDRASDICARINAFAIETMGLGCLGRADPKSVDCLSLQDMLDAVRVVKRFNARPKMYGVGASCHMVPDDRLTAAVYTLINFHDSRATGQDDDDIPVRFTARSRWTGDEHVHFLLVGNRPHSEVADDEQDDDQEAA